MALESTRRYAENKTMSVIDGVPIVVKNETAVVRGHQAIQTSNSDLCRL